MSEKTLKPTRKKVRDARSKGQVARSQDLVRLLSLAAVFETGMALYKPAMSHLGALFMTPLEVMDQPFRPALAQVLNFSLTVALLIALSIGLLTVAVKVAAYWVQQGFVFAPDALSPDFNRLNPVNNLKNLFSLPKLYEFVTNLLKAVLISGIFVAVGYMMLDTILLIGTQSLEGGWRTVIDVAAIAVRTTLGVLLFLTIADIWVQHQLHQRKLKMSQHEVRDERRKDEGNAQVRSRRRTLAQELLMNNAAPPALEQTDVVVVNPTHVAVALNYRPEKVPLPVIMARAAEDDALMLIQQAQARDIPVIRYLWLARTLYQDGTTAATIPRNTLEAVAGIYRTLREWPPESGYDEYGVFHYDTDSGT